MSGISNSLLNTALGSRLDLRGNDGMIQVATLPVQAPAALLHRLPAQPGSFQYGVKQFPIDDSFVPFDGYFRSVWDHFSQERQTIVFHRGRDRLMEREVTEVNLQPLTPENSLRNVQPAWSLISLDCFESPKGACQINRQLLSAEMFLRTEFILPWSLFQQEDVQRLFDMTARDVQNDSKRIQNLKLGLMQFANAGHEVVGRWVPDNQSRLWWVEGMGSLLNADTTDAPSESLWIQDRGHEVVVGTQSLKNNSWKLEFQSFVAEKLWSFFCAMK